MKRFPQWILIWVIFAGLASGQAGATSETAKAPDAGRERQLRYLEESLAINRAGKGRYPRTTFRDKTWQDWQTRTGELPPDFSQMPSRPWLPDPLVWMGNDGQTTAIESVEEWGRKREWIREQFQHWICGSIPPAPGNVTATIVEDRIDGEARVQLIELRFGPGSKGLMTFELLIPPGTEPRPVYMTQWNHRDWAQLAVRRGYIGCVYAGGDLKDDSEGCQELYPEYEFSRLMRRAWGASRVVDYLLTRPEVNGKQIAITGHSRNGKQSLWAGAFDDRIGAVITSSCGTGGITPWRFSDPQFCNETLDVICSIANTWFHPRLRYFFGREDRLPIDQNELIALIAPRPVLMHYSAMERNLNPWAVEQCFHSVRSVYDFLGAGEKLGVYARAGEHAVAARDLERCLDFLDLHFGRGELPWQNTLFFDYNFESWKAAQKDGITSAGTMAAVALKEKYATAEEFDRDREEILEKLDWLLGDEPAGVKPREIAPTVASRVDWRDLITGRPELKGATVLNIGPYTAMGDHMAGKLYYPAAEDSTTRTRTGEKFPVIIYLHQYGYGHGYAVGNYPEGGGSGSRRVLQQMVDNGFAVLVIDMFGFGTRLEEALHFYRRQKGWSKMGKMVSDVSAVVDAVGSFEFLDADRVYVVGDTIGGAVGLMAAARDERIAGVAAVAGFSPWRSSNERYESIRAFSHWHGFLPRLGLFAGQPDQAPVDYAEILACIAPRKLMVVAPTLDRHSDGAAVTRTLEQVGQVYEMLGAGEQLKISRPKEINRMTRPMEKEILSFLKQESAVLTGQ